MHLKETARRSSYGVHDSGEDVLSPDPEGAAGARSVRRRLTHVVRTGRGTRGHSLFKEEGGRR